MGCYKQYPGSFSRGFVGPPWFSDSCGLLLTLLSIGATPDISGKHCCLKIKLTFQRKFEVDLNPQFSVLTVTQRDRDGSVSFTMRHYQICLVATLWSLPTSDIASPRKTSFLPYLILRLVYKATFLQNLTLRLLEKAKFLPYLKLRLLEKAIFLFHKEKGGSKQSLILVQ